MAENLQDSRKRQAADVPRALNDQTKRRVLRSGRSVAETDQNASSCSERPSGLGLSAAAAGAEAGAMVGSCRCAILSTTTVSFVLLIGRQYD